MMAALKSSLDNSNMSSLYWHLLSSHWSWNFFFFFDMAMIFFFTEIRIFWLLCNETLDLFLDCLYSRLPWINFQLQKGSAASLIGREIQVSHSADLVMVFHYCWVGSSGFPLRWKSLRWYYPCRRSWHHLLLLPRWSPLILQVVGSCEHRPDSTRPSLTPPQPEKRKRITWLPYGAVGSQGYYVF